MIFVVLFVTTLSVVYGQGPLAPVLSPEYRNPYWYNNEPPQPYSFAYNALLDDGVGQSSRTEAGDANGRVQGSYTLNNDEGHFRIVDYVADEGGFRATIRTNEPGTESKNPADVVIQSEAVPYQYVPRARRPYLNAPVIPAAPALVPAVEPAEIPENALPPVLRRRPGPYGVRPAVYPTRNVYRQVRPVNRYAFGRQ